MNRATIHKPSNISKQEVLLSAVEPFNLRIIREPLHCVTGLTIPPGLVGFCWETPLCLEVLSQQAPDLAFVARHWTDLLKPILEDARGEMEPGSAFGG